MAHREKGKRQDGYLIACELREGKQHCQKDTPDFLVEVLRLARQITDKPLLFRLDSGNDSADNTGLFMEECFKGDRVHFIIKRNLRRELPEDWLDELRDVCTNIREPREGKKEYIGQTFRDTAYYVPDGSARSGQKLKTVGIRTIYDITERACDHDGQYYIFPKIECDMYSVNVDFPDEDIISSIISMAKWNSTTVRSRQTYVQSSFHRGNLKQTNSCWS